MRSEVEKIVGPAAVDERVARDLWPLALMEQRSGRAASRVLVARPSNRDQVTALLRWASSRRVAVTPMGGATGVCGALQLCPYRARAELVFGLFSSANEETLSYDLEDYFNAPSRVQNNSNGKPRSLALTPIVDHSEQVINIDGSSKNPVTDGFICAKVRKFHHRVYGDDRLLQYPVSDRCREEHAAVQGGGHRGEMVLARPAGDERKEREPEQQVKISPEYVAVDMLDSVQHVVMIVPINPDRDRTHHIGNKDR